MTRTVTPCRAVVTKLAPPKPTDTLHTWLEVQARQLGLCWLLAHADDGVIWGEVRDSKLLTASDISGSFAPKLCLETVQMGRLFGPAGELLLWRKEEHVWDARLISEQAVGASSASASAPDTVNQVSAPVYTDAIDERYLLWGTQATPLTGGFVLFSEGAGQRHAVPLSEITGALNDPSRPLQLWVRHYLVEEPTMLPPSPQSSALPHTPGFTRIATSRLCALEYYRPANEERYAAPTAPRKGS